MPPHPEFPDICLIIDTLSMSGFIGRQVRRFLTAAEGLCPAVVAIHPFCEAMAPGRGVLNYRDADILGCTAHRKDLSVVVVPGNFDLKMIRAAQDLPAFDRFLRIEYDVHCTDADWSAALRDLLHLSRRADLVASYLLAHRPGDDWPWWQSLSWPYGDWRDHSAVRPLRCFCPVSAYSRRFLDLYRDHLRRGLRGHAEVTLSTVAAHEGLPMIDLGCESVGFTRYPQFAHDRPRELDAFVPRFVHPVKTEAALAEIEHRLRGAGGPDRPG